MADTRISAQRQTRASASLPAQAPPIVGEVVSGSGTRLDAPVRAGFEQRLGHSLENVRIHTDSRAAESARAVNARAYNVGSSVVFGAGQFAPQTSQGRQLLAHELTHVIQQRGRGAGPASTQAESEAESVARQVDSSSPMAIRAGSSSVALQRSPADDLAIDEILKAAAAAAKSKDSGPGSNTVIIKIVERYLPHWRQHVGKASFDGKVARVSARAATKAGTLDVDIGKDFLADARDARNLRRLASELETSFAATRIQPDAEAEPDVSKAAVAAKPAPGYARTSVGTTRETMEAIGKRDYWSAKLFDRFFVRQAADTTKRFEANAEERDAVLAVAWKEQPADFKRAVTKQLTIPPRGKGTQPVLYQIDYLPIDRKLDKTRPPLQIVFRAEASAATVAKANDPFRDFTPQPLPSLMVGGFPKNDIKAYWAAHPEEFKRVFFWMEKDAPNPFDQMLEVTTGTTAKPIVRTFSLKGRREPKTGELKDVTIILRDFNTTSSAAPADYRKKDKDAGDFELEKVQEQAGEKLGKINLPRDIPATEASQVKYMVAAYFEQKVRNREVDARIPLDSGEMLYTFRFLANNDVEVVRVGAPKKGSRLDTEKLDIGRSREFMDLYRKADVSGLSTYLGKRYPKVSVTGKTVAEMRVSVNKAIEAKADTAAWFQDNYDIQVLAPKPAARRLIDVHRMDPKQTADLKNFSTDELRAIEQSLETQSLAVLAKFPKTKLARQKVLLEPRKRGPGFDPDPTTAGIVNSIGTEQTMRLFNGISEGNQSLFIGGKFGAMRRDTFSITHEFGHVTEKSDEILKKFNAFVASEGIQPITEYSAGDPKEFFAETFALFNTDPEWLKANQPKLFEWVAAVSKTGKPPP
jgi:hypothetical protein